MTQPITQEQYDLIKMLIERGIAREMQPIKERISKLEHGIKTKHEGTLGE